MSEINKCFAFAEKKEFLDDENSVVCYASTNEVDRHGEMILSTAWTDKGLENYRKNPIILVNHDYNSLPVAKSLWQKTDGNGLKFKIRFAETEAGKEVYSLYKDGYMSSFSVGFRPVKTYDNEDTKKYKDKNGNVPHTVYEECELLELSCVTIPANPSATMLSGVKSFIDSYNKGNFKSEEVKSIAEQIKSSKEYIELIDQPIEENAKVVGFIDLKEKCADCEKKSESEELVEKIETTEEYHHIPVTDKSQFVDGSFRTIDITDGVKAVVGKLKSDPQGSTHVQKYLFDVDKFSLEEAKKWVKDHKKSVEDESEKSFNQEEVKNENIIGDKGISDGFEAGFSDLSDNVVGEIDEIIEGKEMNLDEIIEKAIEEAQENDESNIDEECERITKLFSSCRTKEVDIELLKKQYGEDFDIEKVKTQPATFEYSIFCKYLGCKIKNLFPTSFFIPSTMMGNYLSAFKNVFEKYNLVDQRNFYGNGGEVPLRFSSVQLNSKSSEEFLTDGTRFYETEDRTQKFVTQIYPDWGGVRLDIYTTDKELPVQMNKSFTRDAVLWVKENNFLKGEKFSIRGEFLERTNKGWDDVIFPSDADKNTIQKNVERLSQNSSGRGIMLIGPPGTGKTMTGKVLMEEKTTFIWASSKDFKYGANSALTLGFELCRELAPSIFFLEDIDAWIQGYTVDLLKIEMDGIRANKGVLTILTSNFPEYIPEALIDRPGRFHHIINFSLPNKDNRIKLLKFFTENADKDIIEKFADMTDGFSGSHLKELVDFAKMICEDEGIEIGEALIKSFEQMKEQRQMISDIKAPKKKEVGDMSEIVVKDIIELKESGKIDFELKEKTVDIDFSAEEIKSMMKSAIVDTVNSSKSVDKIVEERIRRMKGIIDYEDE